MDREERTPLKNLLGSLLLEGKPQGLRLGTA